MIINYFFKIVTIIKFVYYFLLPAGNSRRIIGKLNIDRCWAQAGQRTPTKSSEINNNNNNNTLIYIAPACRMTSEAQIVGAT